MLKNKKGQSTLEYVILVTAVMVVIIVFLLGNNSVFTRSLNGTIDRAGTTMTGMSGKMVTGFNTTSGY